MFNFRGLISIFIVITFVQFPMAVRSTSIPGLQNTADFAGELLKNHSYLLEDESKKELDRINRQLRESIARLKKTDTDEQKKTIQEEASRSIRRLLDVLSRASFTIPVEIDGDEAVVGKTDPVEFPGDEGAVVLKIVTGKTHVQCTELTKDYSQFPENRQLNLEVVPDGITWTLVTLINAPAGMVTIPIQIDLGNESSVNTFVQIQTPLSARIRVNVLSADTGQPTSSMMRMVWKTNGRDRRPSNAVEIAPQMDLQGSSSGRRNAQLPGNLSGPYWCVPKPFDMQIPPGEWEIIIRRGVEHLPIFDTFTVLPGETIERNYTPRRWTDMRKHGWYSGDEHVHCRIQSDADAERLMAWVQAEDIHLANVVKMGDVFRTWFEQRGWGKEYRVTSGDTVLSPGQECPRTHQELGHTIHMNTTGMVRDTRQYFLYDWVFKNVKAQGGLSGFCHVLFNMFEVHRGMTLNVPQGTIDFIEIMQFNQMGTDLFYDFLNLGFKMTAAAGSDVPWGGTVGEVRMYAFLGETPFSPDAWFDATRRGRTFVTNGPMLEFQVDDALPGDEIVVGEDRVVTVRARTWGLPERFVPTVLEIVSQGEVIRKIESNDPAKSELSLEFEIPAGNGFWIAARAKGSDGSNAHTTPVYVVRPPFKFWNLEQADTLIQDRFESLESIEQLIDDYQERLESGTDRGNYGLQQFVSQSPELMKRVREARTYYTNLKQMAEKERKLRK